MKFKVGFTIGSETLFAMIAKMLPIETSRSRSSGPSRPIA